MADHNGSGGLLGCESTRTGIDESYRLLCDLGKSCSSLPRHPSYQERQRKWKTSSVITSLFIYHYINTEAANSGDFDQRCSQPRLATRLQRDPDALKYTAIDRSGNASPIFPIAFIALMNCFHHSFYLMNCHLSLNEARSARIP